MTRSLLWPVKSLDCYFFDELGHKEELVWDKRPKKEKLQYKSRKSTSPWRLLILLSHPTLETEVVWLNGEWDVCLICRSCAAIPVLISIPPTKRNLFCKRFQKRLSMQPLDKVEDFVMSFNLALTSLSSNPGHLRRANLQRWENFSKIDACCDIEGFNRCLIWACLPGDLVDATVAAGGAFRNLGSAAAMSPAFTWCSSNMSTCFVKSELVKNRRCSCDIFSKRSSGWIHFGNAAFFGNVLFSSPAYNLNHLANLLIDFFFLLGWQTGILRKEM